MGVPTIKQIADAAHVSTATVSLALRNHPRISKKTAQRIQEMAKLMGYHPNPLVVALMSHVRMTTQLPPSTTLGFINAYPERDPRKVSSGFALYFKGACDRADQLGYRMDAFWAREPGMTARRLSNVLLARGIPGILVGPLPRGRGHLSLTWSKFAASSIGYSMWRPHLHRATSHHAHAILLALRKLQRLGYRKIGLAMSPNFDERVDHHWLANFLLSNHNLEEKYGVPVLIDDTDNMQKFPKWFSTHRPDAIISPHQSAYDWLLRLKVNVPGDVGFVHLDLDPQLMNFSGINQRPELIGAAAVDLLINQLNRNERGVPEDPRLLLIESVWVDGFSTRRVQVEKDEPADKAPKTKARLPKKVPAQ